LSEGLIDHVLGDRLTELDGQFLQVGELGPPRHPLGAIDAMEELFCNPLEEVLQFKLDDGRIGLTSHP